MKIGKWKIEKYERGFKVDWDDKIASHPYIPAIYYKPLYPWAIYRGIRTIMYARKMWYNT